MPLVDEPTPPRRPFPGITVLELEITGSCARHCAHCLSEPEPWTVPGTMTPDDWRNVITDAAALGVPHLRLIGGEPTLHPHWTDLAAHALSSGLTVELYTDLVHIRDDWWELLTRPGIGVTTSYHSDSAHQHDHLTGHPGSHSDTRRTIREAVQRGVRLRVRITETFHGQRVRWAHTDLTNLGVTRVTIDRHRTGGRTPFPGTGPGPALDETHARHAQGRLTIHPNGNLTGCPLTPDTPTGNVRRTPLLTLLDHRQTIP
ncbi:radical SAM protein [Streptomyces sp. JNUCC 64]